MEQHLWLFNGIPSEHDWLIFVCLVTAITSVPLAMRWVPPNGIYGFRTRFTRSNRAIWYAANAFMGRAMIAASMVSASLFLYGPLRLAAWWTPFAIVVVPIAIGTLAAFVYLRHLHETLNRR